MRAVDCKGKYTQNAGILGATLSGKALQKFGNLKGRLCAGERMLLILALCQQFSGDAKHSASSDSSSSHLT